MACRETTVGDYCWVNASLIASLPSKSGFILFKIGSVFGQFVSNLSICLIDAGLKLHLLLTKYTFYPYSLPYCRDLCVA